jgi:hypothetical protein
MLRYRRHAEQEIRRNKVGLSGAAFVLFLWLGCAFAQGQNQAVQLQLALRPTGNISLDTPLTLTIRLKNTAGNDLFVPSTINLGVVNSYGDTTLQWRLHEDAEYKNAVKVFSDTLGAKRIEVGDLLQTASVMLLKPDHFIGLERVQSFKAMFGRRPPGQYDIRVRFATTTRLELDGTGFPKGEFFSNVVTVNVTN